MVQFKYQLMLTLYCHGITEKMYFQKIFQDLFHLATLENWFYGLNHLQKMAVLSSFKWDFEVSNAMYV